MSDSHTHDHHHDHHEHSHGLISEEIKRSKEGLRAVSLSLLVLGITAAIQTAIFISSGSVALLADLIHNFGDALTAVPLGAAFILRSRVAEKYAGLLVVVTIFVSACIAGFEAVNRLFHPTTPNHLFVLAFAGVVGFVGNWYAGIIRTKAGKRLKSNALIADGAHARTDAYISLAVVASAVVVYLGLPIADPLIGIGITITILRVTYRSWQTVTEEI